jgi:hypothetical protein
MFCDFLNRGTLCFAYFYIFEGKIRDCLYMFTKSPPQQIPGQTQVPQVPQVPVHAADPWLECRVFGMELGARMWVIRAMATARGGSNF